mgnify:CR=1 FL=1
MWILQSSDAEPLTFRLSPGSIKTIGRSTGAELILDAALVSRLWSGRSATAVGKGRVIATADLDAGLAEARIEPGFHFDGGSKDARIPFVERQFEGSVGSHFTTIPAATGVAVSSSSTFTPVLPIWGKVKVTT